MIVGRGMLAQAFCNYKDSNDIIIFASGVSNSLEKEEHAFEREINLVKKTISENQKKLFVYFSTCSMYDPHSKHSPYVQHKLHIEKIISEQSNQYLIFRVSQVFGRTKNTTLVNFLFEHINQEKQFDIWGNSNRNIISLTDIKAICRELIKDPKNFNQIFHIANEEYIDVLDLVNLIEKVLHKKAKYKFLNKGQRYQIIPTDIKHITKDLKISFNTEYYFKNLMLYSDTITNKTLP